MLRSHLIVALGACLSTPVSLWAQTSADNALGSVCNSGTASLRALQADPLLSSFFEITCGKSIEAAIGSAQIPTVPAAQPIAPRAEDNSPAISSPLPQVPEVRIDPRVASPSPLPSKSLERPQTAGETPIFREIELQGVSVSAPSALKALAQAFVGKPITLESLDQLTQAIQSWYRAQGMLARTLLPSQDLTDGRVLVTVVESEFTGVKIDDPKGLLRNTQVPKQLVESIQPVGEALNLNQLEEAASRLRDLSGVQTSVQLGPGAEPGETTATVSIREGKASELRISADNHGSRATGEERLSANLRLNNVTQRGDTLLANLLKSEGLEYLGLGYELPFTKDGWRIEGRASGSRYQMGLSENTELTGPSMNLGVGLVIPLTRNSRNSVDFQTTIDSNQYKNALTGGDIYSKYRTTLWGAQLDGQHVDGNGKGQTQWALQVNRGELDLSDAPLSYRNMDELGPQAAGIFNKVRASLTRRDWIDPRNTFTASLKGQWADKNLDGSEKFFLGGARGVRAYPVNEGGGALGYLGSLEWETTIQQNVMGRWAIAGFYDHGRVRELVDDYQLPNNGGGARNAYTLRGYGLWVGTQAKILSSNLGFRVTLARRLGENPKGLDNDNTRILNRVRLDANLSF